VDLTVVIPCRDGASRLPPTLRSVAEQRVEGAVQVVVVDDGSTDGTAEAAAAASLPWGPPRVVRHEAPGGRAAACNSGIEAAGSPLVVILDDDMTLLPGALEAHRAFHERHPRRAALARVVLAPSGRETCFTRFLLREEANRERILLEHAADVPFSQCLTGHFSAPRAALVDAGLFDTRITRYGYEDVEMAWRLVRSGVTIAYLPQAQSVHRAAMTGLDLYLKRHFEVGLVARQLAGRYPEGGFREYLRVEAPRELGIGRAPAGLVALRLANRLLLRRPVRAALASRAGGAILRAALALGERLGPERAVHFGYHVARDLCYFRGYFGEPAPAVAG
jgi:glycosyltransferase involved in cell wall biosynthesis